MPFTPGFLHAGVRVRPPWHRNCSYPGTTDGHQCDAGGGSNAVAVRSRGLCIGHTSPECERGGGSNPVAVLWAYVLLPRVETMPILLVVDDEPLHPLRDRQSLPFPDPVCSVGPYRQEGLELMRQMGPDALILDVRLSDMSGMEVFNQARQIDPQLPVIMITAFATTETTIEAMKRVRSIIYSSRWICRNCGRWCARPWTCAGCGRCGRHARRQAGR